MRIVVALGGNALLKRSDPMTAEAQRANARVAAKALAPVGLEHELVLAHGNGPQVGLLALQAAAYTDVAPYPLDMLGAQTEGMIGYMHRAGAGQRPAVREADRHHAHDGRDRPRRPGVRRPDEVRRPAVRQGDRRRARRREGLGRSSSTGTAGAGWSRHRSRSASSSSSRSSGCSRRASIVICAGGGGIPTAYLDGGIRTLVGIEAVIDKDLASELLARDDRRRPVRHGDGRRRRLPGLRHAAAGAAAAG